MIQLNDTLQYDESKAFSEQSTDVQEYIMQIQLEVKSTTQDEISSLSGNQRPLTRSWAKDTFVFTATYKYLFGIDSKEFLAIKNVTYNMQSNE